MSQKFYKTKAFEKENKKWQRKLLKDGFNDIEQDEHNLRVWSSQFSRKKSLDTYKAKEEYYYMCTQFLNDHIFLTNLDRIIWEYHAEAISARNIAKLLAKVRIKMYHEQVWRVVKRLETIMYVLYSVKAKK